MKYSELNVGDKVDSLLFLGPKPAMASENGFIVKKVTPKFAYCYYGPADRYNFKFLRQPDENGKLKLCNNTKYSVQSVNYYTTHAQIVIDTKRQIAIDQEQFRALTVLQKMISDNGKQFSTDALETVIDILKKDIA